MITVDVSVLENVKDEEEKLEKDEEEKLEEVASDKDETKPTAGKDVPEKDSNTEAKPDSSDISSVITELPMLKKGVAYEFYVRIGVSYFV